MKTSELLIAARERIANPEHWTQGVFATYRSPVDGGRCNATTPNEAFRHRGDSVDRCCAVGAVLVAMPPEWGFAQAYEARHAAQTYLDKAAAAVASEALSRETHVSIIMLNDGGEKRLPNLHLYVLKAYDRAIAAAQADEGVTA